MQPDADSRSDAPRFTRRNPLAPVTKLCPRCLQPLSRGSKLGGWLVPQDYFCGNCGYSGTAYLEKDRETQ